jgi:IS30 family transposase
VITCEQSGSFGTQKIIVALLVAKFLMLYLVSDRPPEVEDRAIPGHWEGDLIAGSQISYISTVVERTSRFTVLVKVPGKDTIGVVSVLSRQMSKLQTLLQQSLTWGRSLE